MAKVIALIFSVIAVAIMLVPVVECANKMDTDAAPIDAPTENYTEKVKAFKAALSGPVEECSANVEECIAAADSRIRNALDDVVAAAPPAKKSIAEFVTKIQSKTAASTLAKAKATGDMNKIAAVSIAYIMAANAVLASAPADKFTVMQETFKVPVARVA